MSAPTGDVCGDEYDWQVAEMRNEVERLRGLSEDCHRVLLDMAVALGEAYISDKPMHPAAHRVLAEKVAALLARFGPTT